jgi:hypothetical protein
VQNSFGAAPDFSHSSQASASTVSLSGSRPIQQIKVTISHRTARGSTQHCRAHCDVDGICYVTGDICWILSFLDLQSGCAAQRSALQGSTGTLVSWFLQDRCSPEFFYTEHLWCKQYSVLSMSEISSNNYTVCLCSDQFCCLYKPPFKLCCTVSMR